MGKKLTRQSPKEAEGVPPYEGLLSDLRAAIVGALEHVASQVNESMVALYWSLGKLIREDLLHAQRASYGKQIVSSVGRQLSAEFGDGFSEKDLRRMIQFAERMPDPGIVATLSRQFGWSHFKELLPIDDELKRHFYIELCRLERWPVRTLRAKIAGMPGSKT